LNVLLGKSLVWFKISSGPIIDSCETTFLTIPQLETYFWSEVCAWWSQSGGWLVAWLPSYWLDRSEVRSVIRWVGRSVRRWVGRSVGRWVGLCVGRSVRPSVNQSGRQNFRQCLNYIS
jgi:hypothetical protein